MKLMKEELTVIPRDERLLECEVLKFSHTGKSCSTLFQQVRRAAGNVYQDLDHYSVQTS
jgi:hypothetical protein